LFGSSAGLIGIRPTTIWDEPGWCSAPIREKEKLNLNQKGRSASARDAEQLDGRSCGVQASLWRIEQDRVHAAAEIKCCLLAASIRIIFFVHF